MLDPVVLSETLGLLPVGLHLLTAQHEGERAGLLCGWTTQVSWTPPKVAVAARRDSHTREIVAASAAFALNLLRPDQVELAVLFGAATGRRVDKFASAEWTCGETGAPLLVGAAGHLECRVADSLETGDHTLFVGDLVAAARSAGSCLVYDRKRHQHLFT